MFWTRLDDFFMTRIADFKDQVADGDKSITLDGLLPIEQLELARLRARYTTQRGYELLTNLLLPQLINFTKQPPGCFFYVLTSFSYDESSILAA